MLANKQACTETIKTGVQARRRSCDKTVMHSASSPAVQKATAFAGTHESSIHQVGYHAAQCTGGCVRQHS